MHRNPTRSRNSVKQTVQYRPIGHRIGTVFHRLRFAVRRGYGTRIEMIPSYNYRSGDLSRSDRIVDSLSEQCSVALPEPTDASRQALKFYFFPRHLYPSRKRFIFRKEFEDEPVRHRNIFRVARKRYPPERSLPLAKERTDIFGNETGKIESVFHSRRFCLTAKIIAVIERHRASLLKFQHRPDVPGHRLIRLLYILFRSGFSEF